MGERLCEAVDLRSGQKVLDVATGSGNTAISAARRYGEVIGLDYVPELIEQAREARGGRTPRQSPSRSATRRTYPYPDGSFDAVLSTVGA